MVDLARLERQDTPDRYIGSRGRQFTAEPLVEPTANAYSPRTADSAPLKEDVLQ